MTDLIALAERVEAATGPDRELDIALLPAACLRARADQSVERIDE